MRFLTFCFSIIFVVVGFAASQADEVLPYVPEGISYAKARSLLIAKGNQPAPWPLNARSYCDYDERCLKFPERTECATDGLSPCLFRWKTKAGHIFMVETVGETVPTLKITSILEPREAGAPPPSYSPN